MSSKKNLTSFTSKYNWRQLTGVQINLIVWNTKFTFDSTIIRTNADSSRSTITWYRCQGRPLTSDIIPLRGRAPCINTYYIWRQWGRRAQGHAAEFSRNCKQTGTFQCRSEPRFIVLHVISNRSLVNNVSTHNNNHIIYQALLHVPYYIVYVSFCV